MHVQCNVSDGLDGLTDSHVVTNQGTTMCELSELDSDILEGVQLTVFGKRFNEYVLDVLDGFVVIEYGCTTDGNAFSTFSHVGCDFGYGFDGISNLVDVR